MKRGKKQKKKQKKKDKKEEEAENEQKCADNYILQTYLKNKKEMKMKRKIEYLSNIFNYKVTKIEY